MLKGIIIAASETELLKETLTKEGLPWTETRQREEEDFRRAFEGLHAAKREILCLVERDREESLALGLGFFCVGYLNPAYPGERLAGCKILVEGFQEVDRTFLENVHTRALGLPVQIAETRRLLIREMTLQDLDTIHKLYQEGDSAFFPPEYSLDRKEEEQKIKAYIEYMYGLYQFGMWVVIEKESGKIIGRAGFGIADYLDFSEVDIGYLIGRAYRRRGYAEEACRAVLAYASQVLDFPGVSAYIEQKNSISLHLIEKLGFRRELDFSYQGRRLYRYRMEFT